MIILMSSSSDPCGFSSEQVLFFWGQMLQWAFTKPSTQEEKSKTDEVSHISPVSISLSLAGSKLRTERSILYLQCLYFIQSINAWPSSAPLQNSFSLLHNFKDSCLILIWLSSVYLQQKQTRSWVAQKLNYLRAEVHIPTELWALSDWVHSLGPKA